MEERILCSFKEKTRSLQIVMLDNALRDESYRRWYDTVMANAGKWVEVDLEHLFNDQFNALGCRIEQYFVDAFDFLPEFKDVDDYLAAVQKQYDVKWPGTKSTRLPNVKSWIAAGNAVPCKFSPAEITELEPHQVFVFGSNLSGRHGKGAARTALVKFGAEYGIGVGPTGQCYALPTKDESLQTMPLSKIGECVANFLDYAARNPDKEFLVTEVGCGLAGLRPHVVAPMFKERTSNVALPLSFLKLLR